MSQNGILYYATGNQYREEAHTSAESVKNVMPDIPIILFTDKPDATDSELYDDIYEIERHSHPFLDRISCFQKSPFDRTLFLDSDTYVTEDISGIFDLLDRFDIAAAQIPGHDPNDEIKRKNSDYIPDVPESFPVFNCGVLLFKDNDKVQKSFQQWKELYRENLDEVIDQGPFREIVYKNNLRIHSLPPEYNCRFPFPGSVKGKVKILHGRHPDMKSMAETINKERGLRVYTGDAHRRIISHPKPPVKLKYPGPSRLGHIIRRLRDMVEKRGWRKTFQIVKKRVPRLLR